MQEPGNLIVTAFLPAIMPRVRALTKTYQQVLSHQGSPSPPKKTKLVVPGMPAPSHAQQERAEDPAEGRASMPQSSMPSSARTGVQDGDAAGAEPARRHEAVGVLANGMALRSRILSCMFQSKNRGFLQSQARARLPQDAAEEQSAVRSSDPETPQAGSTSSIIFRGAARPRPRG